MKTFALAFVSAFLSSAGETLYAAQNSNALNPCEVRVLQEDVPMAGNRFGATIAWNQTTLAVAAPEYPRGERVGVVYLYARNGDNWFLIATLSPDLVLSSGRTPDFGASMVWDDDILYVAAPAGNESSEGVVYRYQDDGSGHWLALSPLLAPDPSGFSGFGSELLLHEDQLFVADVFNSGVVGGGGAVYVFDRGSDDWVFREKLLASDAARTAQFGSGLAAENDQFVVGATLAEQAYIFQRQGDGSWLETQVLASPSSSLQTFFGSSVAMGDGHLFIGAYRTSITLSSDGAVEVFDLQGSTWSYAQSLCDSDPVSGGNFGFGVTYAEGRLFVGTTAGPVDNFGPGRLIIFEQSSNLWLESTRLSKTILNAIDRFSNDVVVDGDLLLVGAPGPTVVATAPGFVQSYSLGGLACGDFSADVPALPLASGGTQNLTLDAGPEHAGDRFVVAGSTSGVSRGIHIDSLRVPLDFDAYTRFLLGGGGGMQLSPKTGLLDAQGRASVTLNLAPRNATHLERPSFFHAYILFDKATGKLDYTSVPVSLVFDE